MAPLGVNPITLEGLLLAAPANGGVAMSTQLPILSSAHSNSLLELAAAATLPQNAQGTPSNRYSIALGKNLVGQCELEVTCSIRHDIIP